MSEPVVHAGVYEHYRGGRYLVLGVARHDETDEPLVVYVRLYSRPGGLAMTARPVASFAGSVEVAGRSVPRFRWVGAEEPEAASPP